jgi:Ca2+/Na+ antiporter
MSNFLTMIGGVAGIALLYYGAEWLIKGGVSVALKMRVSTLVIGLTLVALDTSMPEFVVCADAAIKGAQGVAGAGDISIGNVVGSNICNIALILGLCAVIRPLPVNKQFLKCDVWWMLGSAVLLAVFHYFWYWSGMRFRRGRSSGGGITSLWFSFWCRVRWRSFRLSGSESAGWSICSGCSAI